MNVRSVWIIFSFIVFISCGRDQAKKTTDFTIPVSIKAEGYNVPDDSIGSPEKTIAGSPVIVKAGRPTIIYPKINVTLLLKPLVVPAGKPSVRIPGENNYSLPETYKAVERNIFAGVTKVVTAGSIKPIITRPANISVINKGEGLPHEKISSFLEDNLGNIWIGTIGGGVTKYDGYFFTSFSENEGLSNNRIYSIIQDKDENLWFGTNGGGVTRYDGKYFTRFSTAEGLGSNHVFCIFQDKIGRIWIGTDGAGLSLFDGKSFTRFTEREGFAKEAVRSIMEDRNGTLWFGTDGDGLISYDGKSFKHFTKDEGLSDNRIQSIVEDRDGIIWIGTYGGGLNRYDGINFSHFTVKEGFENNFVKSILQDKNGIIWIGTLGGMIEVKNGDRFTLYTEKDGLSNNSIKSILEDKNGTLWIGSDIDGISKYDGDIFNHFTEREGLSDNRITAIIQDKAGDIWFGYADAGISKFNGKFYTHYTSEEGLASNRITCIIEDKDRNIWIGTEDRGVTSFDGDKFITYSEKHGLCSDRIITSFQDREGNLWFGTTEGVSKFDGLSFSRYTTREGLINNRVFSIFQDKTGNLWFGTDGGGITKYDGKSFFHFSTANGLVNNYIYNIIEDSDGNIWFGTLGGGIGRYDKKSFIWLTEKDGLINDYVYSLLYDRSGNIWAGTRFGLSMLNQNSFNNYLNSIKDDINGTTGTIQKQSEVLFKSFTADDGFTGLGCIKGSILEDMNKTIWIGTNKHLTTYHALLEKRDTVPPNLQLTDIGLFYEPINWGELEINMDTVLVTGNGIRIKNLNFSGLSRFYKLPQNLSLKHNNNYIDFSFTGITLRHSKRVKYQYKLVGLDQNWSSLTLRNKVSFGNLSPGSYTLRVKAMNSEGYWSNEVSYPFTIRPPWWGTWFFRLISVILFIAVLILIYRWRLSNLKRKKDILEKTVKEKTSELQMKNADLIEANTNLDRQKEELISTLESLKSAQNQLVQSEKMASLGVLAAGVAHEINNPLNFIHGGAMGLEDYFKENIPDHLPKVSQLLNGINEGVSRTANIVTSLNRYSRQDKDIRENSDLNQIIDNCLIMLNNIIKGRITIIKEYTSEEYKLKCNESKMHQVLLNVLSNASQSIEKEGIITINTQIKQNKFYIRIDDSGTGIKQENLTRVFDPFFTTKEPGEGTGLGLSISYNIMKEHNGSINISSEPGKGTQLTLMLPLEIHGLTKTI